MVLIADYEDLLAVDDCVELVVGCIVKISVYAKDVDGSNGVLICEVDNVATGSTTKAYNTNFMLENYYYKTDENKSSAFGKSASILPLHSTPLTGRAIKPQRQGHTSILPHRRMHFPNACASCSLYNV